jgi:hypothetical protein
MAAHAAANGVQAVNLRWGAGDHPSRQLRGEPRPGEYWWGGRVERDGNKDILTPLFSKDDVAPDDSPMRLVFDACARHGLRINFQIGERVAINQHFRYHPYVADRLNAAGRRCHAGRPGWLGNEREFYSHPEAIAAFKDRIDAFVKSLGDHPALWAIDIGNEFTMVSGWKDEAWERDVFFPWVAELSGHLWRVLPGPDVDKPFIGVSQLRPPVDRHINQVHHALAVPPDKVVLDWHRYGRYYTLKQIRDGIYGWQDMYPEAIIRIGEDWPWGAGPRPVPLQYQDINIPAEAYKRGDGSFEPDSVSPYPHERMLAFLLMAIPRTGDYTRWWNYLDGQRGFEATVKRCAEILRPASDMAAWTIIDEAERHTDRVVGDLDFKAAAFDGNRLAFVLVGAGERAIDFGLDGSWDLVTWDWASDDPVWVEDREVEGRSAQIDFSRYRDGFCPGVLLPVEAGGGVGEVAEELAAMAEALRQMAARAEELAGRT